MTPNTIKLTGKWISIIVIILSAIAMLITSANGFLTTKDYGELIISFGVFITALRNYIKDHYGVV